MKYQNVLLTIFVIIVITLLIFSIKQDLELREEWQEKLEKGELYRVCGLCCEFGEEGTIINDNINLINVTINLSELNLSERRR